jgi:SHS2 domain-containing protein
MMSVNKKSGFVEIAHTADWALNVWAPDFPALLSEAARGMATLLDQQLKAEPRVERTISVSAGDEESRLVAFLSELLYIAEQEQLGFDRMQISVDGKRINAVLEGAPIKSRRKEIKAVTYHNLNVQHNERGLEVTIVFDV